MLELKSIHFTTCVDLVVNLEDTPKEQLYMYFSKPHYVGVLF